MPKLSETVARLAALNRASMAGVGPDAAGRLTRLHDFGSNPGALQGYLHVPTSLGAGAPLVVVLHGCTQTAAGYDLGAGWSRMADRHGFALLFPEQQRQNNPNGCFNWFVPEDSRRGSGEALSIRQMIEAVIGRHAIDPARVFVTGLSAGGAMASVMLATYPEVFAGGAIIAGLPYGVAGTIPQALDRMRGQGLPGDVDLAATVRAASDHAGRWPIVSVWHGSGDATVNPANAASIVGQWRLLHGAGAVPNRTETVDGYPRRVWCDGDGREVIEEYTITGMGHGTPLDTLGEDGCGRSGAYMLEASISSTWHICRFWNLLGSGEASEAEPEATRQLAVAGAAPLEAPANPRLRLEPAPEKPVAASGVGKVIEDALRAAGLMR